MAGSAREGSLKIPRHDGLLFSHPILFIDFVVKLREARMETKDIKKHFRKDNVPRFGHVPFS